MKTFGEVVDADLKGLSLSQDEAEMLHGDIMRWKDVLVALLQNLDGQFTSRRAAWQLERDNKEKRLAYERWRGPAVGFKLVLVSRLREVKARIRQNMAEADIPSTSTILMNIYAEIKRISERLETR